MNNISFEMLLFRAKNIPMIKGVYIELCIFRTHCMAVLPSHLSMIPSYPRQRNMLVTILLVYTSYLSYSPCLKYHGSCEQKKIKY